MSTATIQLSAIRLDGGTQCRAALDADHIASLAEAWHEGAKIPAIIVFNDGSNNWLADGFHRYHAAEKCDFLDILAEVRSGTRTDAVKFALGANAAHGMRRTNADKRRAVEIALKEFPGLSSAEVARICAVSDMTVKRARDEQPQQSGGSPEARLGADGKIRKMPTATMRHEARGEGEQSPEEEESPPIGGSLADIEHEATEGAIGKPERFSMPPRGMFIARGAIAELEKIQRKDKERTEAITAVRDWCISELTK